MPKPIKIQFKDWVRMMYCIKHLMKLHPEYNEMIMPFYSRMYDLYPYNEDNPFEEKNGHPFNKRDVNETKHFADDFHEGKWEGDSKSLDEIIWDLGLNLPSWEDDDNGDNDEKQSPSST